MLVSLRRNLTILISSSFRIILMIRVNCVSFNRTAADVQHRKPDIGSLWAWHTLGLNIWVISGHLQASVLTCHLVAWPILTVVYEWWCAQLKYEFYFLLSWLLRKYNYFTLASIMDILVLFRSWWHHACPVSGLSSAIPLWPQLEKAKR